MHSSEDEVDGSDREDEEDGVMMGVRGDGGGAATLRTPLRELTGHTSVVIAADWLPGGDQAITAAWDRTSNLYDAHTGELLSQLIGRLMTFCLIFCGKASEHLSFVIDTCLVKLFF